MVVVPYTKCLLLIIVLSFTRESAQVLSTHNDLLQSQMRQVELDTIDVITFLKTQDQKKDNVVCMWQCSKAVEVHKIVTFDRKSRKMLHAIIDNSGNNNDNNSILAFQ